MFTIMIFFLFFSRTNISLHCLTGVLLDETDINNPLNFVITIEGQQNVITYSTGVKFEYHRNPNITGLSRVSTIERLVETIELKLWELETIG